MIVKRVMDLLGAGLGITLLLPVFLAVAVVVKMDSPGPIFFRQTRVGRGGSLFQILKFRTMVERAEELGPKVTTGLDSRITRSGRFIRKYKLDELPQLFNVLTGSMSLVGPRPEVPEYVQDYPETVRDKVLSVRPGITDLASVEYRNENDLLEIAADPVTVYRSEILPKKLALCVRYVERRSFIVDLKIIFRTIVAILRPG